ncbi:UNVERIFIED_CONTAM: hypothetical protein GTU68_031448 [Idotea baltica]|nr:hypothetical protein [Idotea baltica]
MRIDQALATGQQLLLHTESPEIDCQALLCHLLQCNTAYLRTWPDKMLSAIEQGIYSDYLQQRLDGKPVAYIIEQRGFWSLNLKVSPDTLIPRPDTESLVMAALDKIKPQMIIADLGTGTGAVALALASERADIHVIASDYSLSAIRIAQHNKAQCQLINVSFWQGSWLSAIRKNSLDMIVSNPPYIAVDDPHLYLGDVGHEPRSALVSGHDGLNDIRLIAQQAKQCLKPEAWLMIEHGYQQASAVQQLFRQMDFEQIETIKDVGDNDRVTIGQQSL